MFRWGFVFVWLAVIGCGNKKKDSNTDDNGFSYEKFSAGFKSITPPYQLSDTGFMKNSDSAVLRFPEFQKFISDSLVTRLFGKGSKPRYISMVQMKPSDQTSLYLVKAISGNKRAALLMAFDKGVYRDLLPFIIPDSDPSTSQLSSIDRAFTITKNISQKKPGTPQVEGKEVYAYDPSIGDFSLILINPINPSSEIVNPIDSFSRKHKFTGDYNREQKNFISIRDGRYSNQLQFFIHVEKNNSECMGELRGDLLLTSATTGIYRQGGDPCVLSFRFSGNSVTVKEDEGCGAHRGLDCLFDGSYSRKKEKSAAPKKQRK